jgi:putative ATP-binding cassette transporter
LLTWHLRNAVERMRDGNISAVQRFIAADTFGAILFFVIIGLAIALHSLWYGTDKTVLGGFVLVMLYLRGPLETLSNALPAISNAQVALRRIVELREKFSSPEPHLLVDDRPASSDRMECIELRNVCYEFAATADSPAFWLGPLDLTIERGDIVFIVGENGSGKTTLFKLMLGLYTPLSGQILWNGEPVSPERRDDYRQLFTTVFADYFLFDELPGADQPPAEQVNAYLHRLKLAHKVGIRDGRFTTTDLSTGQRKRLALINAWLERRPVLLFDEWAADQDPVFRRLFYTTLLPELKAAGKTVIAISHDDRYFDIADHIVHMENGRIRMERPVRQAASAER